MLGATAYATTRVDRLWVTNSYGSGAKGQRFDFDGYGGGSTYPCLTNRADQNWSPGSDGASWGISRDWAIGPSDPCLYVSTRSPHGADGSGAPSGEDCIGAAKVDVSDGSFTETWNTNHYMSASPNPPIPTDVLGNAGDIVDTDKTSSTSTNGWYQYNDSSSSVDYSNTGDTEASDLAWVDGTYFVATMAGSNKTAGDCPGTSPTWNGQLWLSTLNDGDTTPEDIVDVGGSDSGSKPEGVTVADIDPTTARAALRVPTRSSMSPTIVSRGSASTRSTSTHRRPRSPTRRTSRSTPTVWAPPAASVARAIHRRPPTTISPAMCSSSVSSGGRS